MKALAITSSTTHASIALGDGNQTLQKAHSTPRGHVEFMNSTLDELLRESGWALSDLDVIAVDRGPGSFTGIRVAVNIGRSLCYLLKKPCYLTESLDILATEVPGFSIALVNAYKNLVFAAPFENGKRLDESKVLGIEDFESWVQDFQIEKPTLVGDGWTVYESEWSKGLKNLVVRDPKFSDFPSAETLANRAIQNSHNWIQDWNLVTPLYLRESAAEENLHGSKTLGRRIR